LNEEQRKKMFGDAIPNTQVVRWGDENRFIAVVAMKKNYKIVAKARKGLTGVPDPVKPNVTNITKANYEKIKENQLLTNTERIMGEKGLPVPKQLAKSSGIEARGAGVEMLYWGDTNRYILVVVAKAGCWRKSVRVFDRAPDISIMKTVKIVYWKEDGAWLGICKTTRITGRRGNLQ